MPLTDWIKEFYIEFLKNGWKLEEIEEIDMDWYFSLTNHQEEKETNERTIALDNAGL